MPDNPALSSRHQPAFLREREAVRGSETKGYDEWELSGVLLFVDIVGFTWQVEQFTAQGPDGVERASEMVNDSIGRLVDEVAASGGDVVSFAGDALFALWRAEDGELGAMVSHVARCALAALESHVAHVSPDRPSLRLSLGAGCFLAHRVGGYEGRWQGTLSGPAFAQVGRADALACNDALVASPEACALARGALRGEALDNGMLRVHGVAANGVAIAQGAGAAANARASFEQTDARALAEIRHPSTVFARLTGVVREGALDGAQTQAATQIVQRVVGELEGTLLQFAVDDKGPVFVIAFGLAAHVHEDDPVRAALAGLRIVNELAAVSIACGVGVATGRVFCGLIGTDRRCDYTLIGQTMNLAARLMQHASPGPLADSRTRELSHHAVDFEDRGPIRVKGVDQPMPHYRVSSARAQNDAPDDFTTGNRKLEAAIVGRIRELEIVGESLDRLVAGRGGVLVLIGEAGIGKSHLVREIVARAGARGVLPLIAPGSPLESNPQVRWRASLKTLMARGGSGPAQAEDAFLQAFLFKGESSSILPELDDQERALRTRDALADVFTDATRDSPLLLCVEDAHWMDSLSWSLVARLSQWLAETGAPLLLLLTARELETAPADALARIERAGLERLSLGPLTPKDRARVAASAIGASTLPASVARWIAAKSGGNPFFCRELAVAAFEHGRLKVVDGRALWSDGSGDTTGLEESLPDTLQGLIASRLDRLDPADQLVLRMASVIGPEFALTDLLALHPVDATTLRRDLARLAQDQFLEQRASDAEGRYAFHHLLVRDAAYDSLPYRRRRELHAAMASWMETRPAADPPPNVAALAYHRERAEQWLAAFETRLQAGEIALRSYANREAVQHFAAAQAIRERLTELAGHAQARRPELGLARAHHRMGDEEASRRQIEQALRAFGDPLPRRQGNRVGALLIELTLRLLPPRFRPLRVKHAPEVLRDIVRAYDLLPEILYYQNDPLGLALVSLRFLRLAQAEAQASAERARALASYALLLSGFGRLRTVDRTFDIALAEIAVAGDASVDAWIRLARGSVLAQFGAWDEAERWLRDASTRCADMGDRTRAWNVSSALGHVLSYQGRLVEAGEVFAGALAANRDTDNPLFMCWGLSGHAEILLRRGEPTDRSETVRLLRAAREQLEERPDPAADLFSRGLLCAALWREGAHVEALSLATDTVETALDRAPVVWLHVGSYLCLHEVLCAAAHESSSHRSALQLLKRLERSLRAFARLIRVARPALGLVCGQLAQIQGKTLRAQRHLRAALRQAQELRLPLETGRLYLALADTLPADEARLERDHAIAVLTRIDARHDLRVAHQQN